MSVIINGRVYSGNHLSIAENGVLVDGQPPGGAAEIRGNGQETVAWRPLNDSFSSIQVSGIDALQVNGDESNYGLDISAEANLVDQVETSVHEGVLRIQVKDGVTLKPQKPVTVTLFAENLRSLTASGQVQSYLGGLHSDDLEVNLTGQCLAVLEGTARTLDLHVSGQSRVKADDLEADRITADVSATSEVSVWNLAS